MTVILYPAVIEQTAKTDVGPTFSFNSSTLVYVVESGRLETWKVYRFDKKDGRIKYNKTQIKGTTIKCQKKQKNGIGNRKHNSRSLQYNYRISVQHH
jgi:hypothetical protein